jgi:phenylacetate-CoA ligase
MSIGSVHFDGRETRDAQVREDDLMARLPLLMQAALSAPGWRRHLGSLDPRAVRTRADLARLPVLRKADLIALQRAEPPFAGLTPAGVPPYARWFSSPGPIYEPEGAQADPWRTGRGLYAAGLRRGDVVLNTFSYHLTPGGFILDSGARAVGCAVIPAGPGNTAQQLDLIAHLAPTAYTGTPDFLKILLDAAAAAAVDVSCIRTAVVSGAACPPALQAEFRARGVDAYQHYATADLGLVAFETTARNGMVVNEDVLLEIVRPGTGEPVDPGEVGEVVVTSFDEQRPWIRLALGDLSAIEPASLVGPSSCGRTNARIRGWLGRADQAAKVKGMFVRPEQLAQIVRQYPELGRVRLEIRRDGAVDAMTLRAESSAPVADWPALGERVVAALRTVMKLGAQVQIVPPGSLPNDGRVIEDTRG